MQKLLTWLNRGLLVLSGAMILAMMVHICTDVASRFFLRHPLVGTTEFVTYYYMVACIFLALPVVQESNGHISVELLTTKLGLRAAAAVEAFAHLAVAVFTALVAWKATEVALKQTAVRETAWVDAIKLETWPARWFVVMGAAVMALWALLQFTQRLLVALRGEGHAQKREA
jgi:TRAP-type C4-dicarboxylate transport system permease small subunit